MLKLSYENLKVWDYKLPKNLTPKNDFELQWYLKRLLFEFFLNRKRSSNENFNNRWGRFY
jgi:hypothetical protein